MCPQIPLNLRNPAALTKHIGTHILFGNRARLGDNPCGFCLSTDGSCKIWLDRRRGKNRSVYVDLARSRCPNKSKLSLGQPKDDKVRCTNKPIYCPIEDCADTVPAFWTYNLLIHLTKVHGLEGPRLTKYKELYEVSAEELKFMKKEETKIRNSRTTAAKLQRNHDWTISEAHRITPPKQ